MPDPLVKFSEKKAALPSCFLRRGDLETLFSRLEKHMNWAYEAEVKGAVKPQNDNGEFDEFLARVKNSFAISIIIEKKNGERHFSRDASIFLDADSLENINAIYFDSGRIFRDENNNSNPRNYFTVLIDFSKPNINAGSLSNATPNNSNITVSGWDDLWVGAVYQTAMETFNEWGDDKTRKWLHSAMSYDFLLWLIIAPAFLLFVGKNEIFSGEYTNAGWFLYCFIVVISIYRAFYTYAKWIWPKLGIEYSRDTSRVHRYVLSILIIGIIAGLISASIFEIF